MRRGLGGAAAAGMLITGAVVVSAFSASGAEPPEATVPAYEPFGTLTVNLTDDENFYSLTGPEGNPIVDPEGNPIVDPEGNPIDDPETILVDQPCATVLPGSGRLLVLAANPSSGTAGDTVQVRNRAFGVNTDGTSCGSSAAAVISGAEQLELELGPILPDDVFIESGILQVSQNKKGNLAYSLDGSTPVPVAIGRDAQDTPQAVPIAAEFDGAGDVVIDDVSDLFTSITVESDSTKENEGISIADGTTFNLVQLDPDFEVAVDCGEQVSDTGAPGEIAPTAVYVRGVNAINEDKLQDCELVGVTVDIEEEFVFWDNSFESVLGNPQATSGKITITWAGAPAWKAGTPTLIDYDADGIDFGYQDSLFCLSFTEGIDPATGDPVYTVTFPPYDSDDDGDIDEDDEGTAPWCVVSRTDNIVGNQVFRTDVFVGAGDPRGQFK